jgi:hypothetical protein
MRKRYKLEVEVALDDAEEHQAIQVAREHYRDAGAAEAPVDDRAKRWRKIPAKESVPDAAAAIMELIDANHLLEKAGIEVVGVSCGEPEGEGIDPNEPGGVLTTQPAEGRTEEGAGRGVDLDEPETGMYLCRWPNGDFSLVRADTRRQALVELDEWAGAHPSQLFPMDCCMLDFGLNERGQIEFKQFGEETNGFVWKTAYPELDQVLSSDGVPEPGDDYTPAAKDRIRQAVEHERVRLWENQPECPQAETEIGKILQKRLRTVGPVADYYVKEMASRILKAKGNKSRAPN